MMLFTANWVLANHRIPPAYQSIDPLKDADADLKRIRSRTLTLPEAIAQQGYDVEQQLIEIEATNKVLDTKGIILDCDPRRVNDKGAVRPNPEKAAADSRNNIVDRLD